MKPRCGATKRDGTPCTLPVNDSNGFCWAHSPEHAERRRKAASRGGKGKPGREIKDLKQRLEKLARDVLAGDVEKGDAAVVNQILNTIARLIELERKLKETEELEARVQALEEARRGGPGGRNWGA